MKYAPIIFFVLLCCLIAKSHAQARQDEEELPLLSKDRFYKGGGLGIGLDPFNIQIYPSIGYKITPRFSVGVSGTYMYLSYKVFNNTRFQYKVSTSVFGGSVFTRYFVTQNIFLHGEYEILSMDVNLFGQGSNENKMIVPAALLGGGYTSYISNKTAIYLMILYDFEYSNYSLQSNPRIVAGIGIGL